MVTIKLPESEDFILKFLDASGKLIRSESLHSKKYQLGLSSYAKGLYRLWLQGDTNQISRWIVKE